MITVKCPNAGCPASFQVPEQFLGKSVRCKKCNTKFKIDGSTSAASEAVRPGKPTAIAPTLQESDSPFRSASSLELPRLPAPDAAAPTPEPAEDAANKQYLLYIGLAAGGVFSCVLLSCIGGVAFFWSAWGGRSPETYGGIELSSTTVKSFVAEFYADADAGFDYRFPAEEVQETTDFEKLGPDGNIDKKAMDKSVQVIAAYFKDLQGKHGLPRNKIVIVAASGAFNNVDPSRLKANQDTLRNRVMAETQQTIEIVTLEEELHLQIRSLIPDKQMDRTMLVDLGNSLCRGGGYNTVLKDYTIFNPKIGVKGFTKKTEADASFMGYKGSKTPEQRRILAAAATKSVEPHFRKPLIAEMNKVPQIHGRKRVELIGGVPWVTATYKNPAGRAKKHTPLTTDDIDSFYQEVRVKPGYPKFKPPNGMDDKLRERLVAEVDGMEPKIPVERLIAGTEMLKVLSQELTFADREVYFNNNGQKGLVLGFMARIWEKNK